MAMHSSRLTQDRNFSVHLDGVETNESTVQKTKGGLRGRKACNDISNSKNVIPIGEDLGISKKARIPVGGKAQPSGRKALKDVTNSVNRFGQQQSSKKRGREKISISVAEDEDEKLPYSVSQECFLHNHEECIKSQKTTMDLHHFLKTIGLDEDASCQTVSACDSLPRKPEDEDLMMLFEMEEIPNPKIEDQSRGQSSPICGSPNSPGMSYVKDWDEFPSFILEESPRR